ncbi:probable RNA-binding protein ARP1 isoform X2 [Syzygium oleosum]|uniref:probable RNA-binding protein ARP1 isoform X2 n=1 Tax=Syzygium oleosum TaxID=219896 RepID=UPI0011D19C42|nr:probable RNA-binding protein ARP1 isoform X2 [Syzygium oleosum]
MVLAAVQAGGRRSSEGGLDVGSSGRFARGGVSVEMTMSSSNVGQFGDTTLTKVFVGGLAWETPKEAMREHFEKYGEILEAVIILDKVTGRSKGYGFVTFKDPEAAKKACEEAMPVINGRRANCNLASLGARRPKSAAVAAATPPPPPPPLPQQGSNIVGPRSIMASTPANHQMQWYYPAGTPALPYHHQHHQAVPFYGYSPAAYIATDMNYNHKVSYTGGAYMNAHYSQVYPSQAMMPMYPLYPHYPHHHQSHTMGLPAHIFQPASAGPMTSVPALVSKPASIAAPNTVCLAVE